MTEVIQWKNNNGVIFDDRDECAKSEGLFPCPKCEGDGYWMKPFNAYPSGLPDSGWVQDIRYKHESCIYCMAEGYVTSKKIDEIQEQLQYENLKKKYG